MKFHSIILFSSLVQINFSQIVEATTPPDEIPKNLYVSVNSSSSLRVSWSHITEWFDNSTERKYSIKYQINGTDDINEQIVSPDVDFFIIGDLIPLNVYQVSIGTKNAFGTGPYSGYFYETTPAGAPIASPMITSAFNTSASSFNVTWYDIKPFEWGGDKKKFRIVVGTLDSMFLWYPNISESSMSNNTNETLPTPHQMMFEFNVSGLKAFTTYEVQISCVNMYGEGPLSEKMSAITEEEPPNYAPEKVVVELTFNTSILIKWKKIKLDDLHGNFTEINIFVEAVYDVTDLLITNRQYLDIRERRSTSEYITGGLKLGRQSFIETDESKTDFNVTNLMGDTNYKISLAIKNKFLGVLSPPVSIKTLPSTPFVSAFNVSCESDTPTSLLIRWRHSPPAYLQGARTKYKIYYKDASLAYEQLLLPDRTSLYLIRLPEFTNYTVWMTSFTDVGEGNPTTKMTCQTRPALTKVPPNNLQVESYFSPNKTMVTWEFIPWYEWPGAKHGYTISYRRISTGEVHLAKSEWSHVHLGDVNSHLLMDLKVYSTYEIKAAGRTNAGVGKYSPIMQFRTCNVPSPEIQFYIKTLLPYIGFNSTIKMANGIFSNFIQNAILTVAGHCEEFERNISIDYIHESTDEFGTIFYDVIEDDRIAAPYLDHIKPTSFFEIVDLLKNEGFTLVSQKKNQEEKLKSNEKFLFDGLKTAAPLFILCVLFHFPFGAMFWFLEPRNVNYEKRGISLYGICEGIYLALQISSTVGYGDKMPKTIRGRIYNMFWSILGISLVGIVIGNLSSILISAATTVNEIPSDEKIVAAKDSAEYNYAMQHLTVLDRDAVNLTYFELFDGLYNGSITHALIDNNVALLNKFELVKNNFELKQVMLDVEMNYGFALFGKYKVLKKPLQDFVRIQESLISLKLQELKEDTNQKIMMLNLKPDEELPFMTPSSPLFQLLLIVLICSLVGAVIMGSVYEVYRQAQVKRQQRQVKTTNELKTAEKEELLQFSSDFMSSFREFTNRLNSDSDRLLMKHAEELMCLQKQISDLYGINFKYIKTYDLNLPMEELVGFSDEIKARKEPSLTEKSRTRAKSIEIRLSGWVARLKRSVNRYFTSIKDFFTTIFDFFC